MLQYGAAMGLHFSHSLVAAFVASSMVGWYIHRSTLLEVRDTLEKRETMKAKDLDVPVCSTTGPALEKD